ncbi:GcvT family protein [Phaeovulum sp.]|uniref:GcvT family protein n=1 Tax=Phaeovulum sp. TaxID=2934796 RepID=UPI00272FE617|nr:FAD-dependent oxidoreductase [Phaeovulum sp.]MDP1669967.1 FAD-dependent oxidoreductase [Phaeovulum sp.]MDZ4118679.1 FAD-dependent oxidoreductase [Phaeovulum sp.]
MIALPASARVVIIGGGISGCSVAYHLARLGWRDIVLLERQKLTSGTTWHAAGLVGQLRASLNMTRLAKYSADLYARLGDETGLATGFRACGSISVALTNERREELLRQAGLARAFGVEVAELSLAEIKAMYPHLNTEGVTMGVHLPADGQADPGNIALALAKGARAKGALIAEGVKVAAVTQAAGRVTGVTWVQGEAQGHIAADLVVNAAGMWGRDLAAASGVALPLHACEHFYVVTEPIAGLERLPVLRVPDECAYYKEDAGKILLGAFEPKAKPWGMQGIPESFCFDQLPEDFDHFEPILAAAVNRMPMLASAGIHTFFNGPESFTPDDLYYLGEAPELGGYWVAAGYNSIGIVSSGGAGMALASWMDSGEPPFDLWDVDIRRAQPFQKNRRYLRERVSETLGLLYADHFPYRQPATARGIRRSPVHEHLKAAGAVFGETAGWERANWFAAAGEVPEYRYSWGRQNWFENSAAEHRALRQGVGLIDMSSFGKIRVEGPGALALLERVAAAQIDVDNGRIVYCQMLNARGGIESDLTITRLSETAFLLVVPAATLQRDLAWLRRNLGGDLATITDVTAAEAVLCLMGPRAREVLAACSPADLSNTAHGFGTARETEVGMGLARAHRISYVGELGWELYVSADQAAHVFEALTEAGTAAGLRLCGLHAMNSCRMEKAYRSFGHDITDEDHVLEAGLGFAVATDKGGFIGREAVLRKREAGLTRRLVQFLLSDPEPMLYHNEPILRDGRIVGVLASGAYGHSLGGSVGLGYVPCTHPGESGAEMLAARYEIEVAGQRIAVRASLAPLYDPKSERPRA